MRTIYVILLLLIVLPVCLISGYLVFTSFSSVEHGNVAFDVSPDGNRVVFSDAGGDLWLFDLTTQAVTRLTSTPETESTPSFAPDGKAIVYASRCEDAAGSSIFTRSIDGSDVRRLTKDRHFYDLRPSFSPDGKTIAFARAHLRRPYSLGGWTWDCWDIYAMDTDGSNLRRLTKNEHYCVAGVSFSADSRAILYSADESRGTANAKQTLFEVSLDGKTDSLQPEATGRYCSWISDPYSSSDGPDFVFISDRAEAYHYDVFIMNRQSEETRSLGVMKVSPYNQKPIITDDGTAVLFLAGREWNAGGRAVFSLWRINADGSEAKQLADSR